MELARIIQPGPAGLTLAAGAIVAGARLFSSGWRAARLRRCFRELRESRLAELPSGFAHVRGRVELESPLFAPLSGLPCAYFQLEVRAPALSLHRVVEEWREFRIEDAGVSALVTGEGGRWEVAMTAERELGADQPLGQGLAALLERVPESLWWRSTGGTLVLAEHALPAGAECHVVGTVEREAVAVRPVEWIRTGTAAEAMAVESDAMAEVQLEIVRDDRADFLLVADRPPRPDHFRVPALRAVGVLAGPALGLTGILYLASAAERLRALGGF